MLAHGARLAELTGDEKEFVPSDAGFFKVGPRSPLNPSA
jgi:hypothetical protein